MRFQYIASQPNGKIIEGDFEASGAAEVFGISGESGVASGFA